VVETEWRESREGPPRKYYALTDSGREEQQKLRDEWLSFVGSVNGIIKEEPQYA
jgi:PadR family transcriptional regulator PadR